MEDTTSSRFEHYCSGLKKCHVATMVLYRNRLLKQWCSDFQEAVTFIITKDNVEYSSLKSEHYCSGLFFKCHILLPLKSASYLPTLKKHHPNHEKQ